MAWSLNVGESVNGVRVARRSSRDRVRFGVLLVIFALFVGAAVVASLLLEEWDSGTKVRNLWMALLAGIIVLLLGFVALHVWVFHFKMTRSSGERIGHPFIGALLLKKKGVELFGSVTPDELQELADSILHPEKVCGRIFEEIRPDRRTLRQIVTSEIVIPKGEEERFLYPLLRSRKSEMQHDLSVFSADGQRIPTLTYMEYVSLMAKVLEGLFAQARHEAGLIPASVARHAEMLVEVDELEKCAIEIVAYPGELNGGVDRVVDWGRRMTEVIPGSAVFGAVRTLVLLLAEHYVTVAELSRSSDREVRCVVRCERYLVPSFQAARARGPLRFVKDCLRAMFGAQPVDLELDISNAARARSYDMMVYGPPGMYVGWQRMPDPANVFAQTQFGVDDVLPYRRFARRLGQSFLHVHMRSAPVHAVESARLSVRFFETPPGSMGRAATVAGATFALVYVAGLVVSFSGKTVDTDFPAIVLAFPAIAATLIGLDGKQTTLIDGTLSSRASAGLTAFLSVVASALYMAQASGRMVWMATGFKFLGVREVWWQVIVLFALLNFAIASYVWWTRTFSYYSLIARANVPPVVPTEPSPGHGT